MHTYELTHLSDRMLLQNLGALAAHDRHTTAALLAHIAEVDARRLYAAGFSSMYDYCVHELHLSEDAAYKRIQAARIARRFPVLFDALADGRLHLTAVNLIAPHLIVESADGLIRAASGKTKPEIEGLLARRFPRTESLPLVYRITAQTPAAQLAPAQVEQDQPGTHTDRTKLAPAQVEQNQPGSHADRTELAPAQVGAPVPRSRVAPIATRRFMIQASVDQETYDKLRHAQALLSHKLPSGDIAQVLDLALESLVKQLEKRKFAATDRPSTNPRPSTGRRTIPARVKRAVWKRDRGQCAFVSSGGRRCDARMFLEYDHVDPVARGGEATTENLRLRCRAHNQLEAERAFGVVFMNDKREAARLEVEQQRVAESDRDVMAALRHLGYRVGEARQAAEFSRELAGGPLEERVRMALSYFRPRSLKRAAPCSKAA